MKLLNIVLILNSVLMVNTSHALDIPGIDIRSELRAGSVFPTNGPASIINYSQLNLSSGASFNISSSSSSWILSNRVYGNAATFIEGINSRGGSIQVISPGGLVLSGASIEQPRTFLSASTVPEADTYSMVLAGLGLIGAIIRRRLM
jgi:filamentous hemagglutinin family protein